MAATVDEGTTDGRFRGSLAPGGRVTRGGVILLLLVGVTLTLIGAVPLIQSLPVLLYSERAWASVQAVDQLPRPNEYRVFVEFTAVAGRKTRAQYDLSDLRRTRRLVPGDQVEVFYPRDNPERVELYRRQPPWIFGWLWLMPGLFVLWLGKSAWEKQQSEATPPISRKQTGKVAHKLRFRKR